MGQWYSGTLVLDFPPSSSSSSAPHTTQRLSVKRDAFPSFAELKLRLGLNLDDRLEVQYTCGGVGKRTSCAEDERATGLRDAMDELWRSQTKNKLVVKVRVTKGGARVATTEEKERRAVEKGVSLDPPPPAAALPPPPPPAPDTALIDIKVVHPPPPPADGAAPAQPPAPVAHLVSFVPARAPSFAHFLLLARHAVGLPPDSAVEVTLLDGDGAVRLKSEREWREVGWTRAKRVAEEARARGDWGAVTVEVRAGLPAYEA
ncbi:hypothetical protein JCM10207_000018 [Rhodosporidiobolus poonsookiae]